MSYTLSISISIGSSRSGLSLSAQLFNYNGDNIGDSIVSGFVEIGRGNYLWTYDGFPDNFRGGVKFYNQADPLVVLAITAINPEEAEYVKNMYNTIRTQKQIEIVTNTSSVDIKTTVTDG